MAIGRKKFIRCGVFCVRTKHGWEAKPVPMRLGNNGCYSFLLPIKPTTQHKLFLVWKWIHNIMVTKNSLYLQDCRSHESAEWVLCGMKHSAASHFVMLWPFKISITKHGFVYSCFLLYISRCLFVSVTTFLHCVTYRVKHLLFGPYALLPLCVSAFKYGLTIVIYKSVLWHFLNGDATDMHAITCWIICTMMITFQF